MMTLHSRRRFLKLASAAVASGTVLSQTRLVHANPLGLPAGLQLYSVRAQLPKDYEGTLQQLAAIGYKEVEAAGFFGHDAAQVNTAMKNAGLRCVSAHYAWNDLKPKLDEVIEFCGKIGLGYLICAYPGHKDPSTAHGDGFTLEDWRWNAEQFNLIGEKVKAAGMRFGYHNHAMEFKAENGVIPLDELLRLTDADKVTLEMDCGWVVVGGKDPVEYLNKYPTRFSMLHVKDFKTIPKPGADDNHALVAAELGQGAIDYTPIFAAAKKSQIKHIFVEQEEFDMAPMASLKIDAEYLMKFKG